MRTLTFDPTDRKYERIYAILVTGQPNRDRSQQKTHGSICDKLEVIGQIKTPVDDRGEPRAFKEDELRFYVTVSGGRVMLEEQEYEMIKERCYAAIPGIHVSLSRDLERSIIWLEGLPKQEAAAAPLTLHSGADTSP